MRPDPAPPVGRQRRSRRLSSLGTASAFLLPLGLFYGLYFVYAFVFLFRTSRQQVDLSFTDIVDVGWNNFRLVLTDDYFRRAIINNFVIAGVWTAAALTIAFFIAMSLASGVRLRRFFYIVFLLPSLIPLSLFATVFGRMLETDSGAVNQVMRALGLARFAQDWLGSEGPAYAALFVLLVLLIGLPITYYTSDLSTVSTAVLESAMIDGASTWQFYRLILFPMMRNTHRTVILSTVLGTFRAFDLVFFSTRGEPGGRTAIAGTYLYQQTLGESRVGYASAAAIIVLAVALIVSAINLVIQKRIDR